MSPTTSSTKTPVTSETALMTLYDIETLSNVFTLCAYSPHTNHVGVFYLIEPGSDLDVEVKEKGFDVASAWQRIVDANPAYQDKPGLGRPVSFHDLSQWSANVLLARVMGLSDAVSVNDPASPSTFPDDWRPTCDTDPDYDPVNLHPYLAGYNSFNYDTVMLAIYFNEAFANMLTVKQSQTDDRVLPVSGETTFRAPLPSNLRKHNDALFEPETIKYMPRYLVDGAIADGRKWQSTAHKIRQAMLNSGRHIDIARFNELQQRVALKRLLGGLGGQILESDKLGSHNSVVTTVDELMELLAYNVSDCVGLEPLAKHPAYASGFDLKKGLLDEYQELIYGETRRGSHKMKISPDNVRFDRLSVDASSAKFVGKVLAPYSNLDDQETVSYLYPSARVAKEQGIEQVNVLDECWKFFQESLDDPEALVQFKAIHDYYKDIEGKNFNDSDEYGQAFPTGPSAHYLANIQKVPNNIPYFHADGTPSSCFATFSTGGIHGAEADIAEYEKDLGLWQEHARMLDAVKAAYPDPLDVRLARTIEIEVPDEDGALSTRSVIHTEVLSSKSTIKALTARSEAIAALGENPGSEQIADIDRQYPGVGYKPLKKKPTLFEAKSDGSTKLKPKYAFTSAEEAIHEDFTSYYPNMLRNMSAFYNEDLGGDRYTKIFYDKEEYGRLMKDPSVSETDRKRYKVLREGTKLVLNTASGAGDATHKTPIRMNNRIISMRIIG